MNAQTKIEPSPLAKLREPFAENQISKLPKPTKPQTDAVRADFKKGIRCKECGAWHHPDVIHLDYVGHAAATDRLLDADLRWTWDPVPDPASLGLPTVPGGMWIKLTVDGVSRYGFGSADGKTGGDAVKEIIGDAIRNAGMRFGMALDLWHKGVLHADDEGEPSTVEAKQPEPSLITKPQWAKIIALLEATNTNADAVLKRAQVDDLKKLTDAQAIKAINLLEDKLAKMAKDQSNQASQSQQNTAPGDFADGDIPY